LPQDLAWHDVRDWGIEGKGFADTASFFDRLPARAEKLVRPAVWNLSRHTSGMSVRFETDAEAIYLRYRVTSSALAMPHMPATGVSGMDLYTRTNAGWRFAGVFQPTSQSSAGAIARELPRRRQVCQINLPLYNGVESLEIGVARERVFEPVAPRKEKPILFYGTSITQGGCASRPGMAFLNILGRRLDRPILNFGFSGNGRMEIEVARLLAELDPAIYVLDCSANAGAAEIAQRAEPLVRLWRDARPHTPILMLEERAMVRGPPLADELANHRSQRAALRRSYENLLAAGVKQLHYQTGDQLIGDDGEATVDGSHPSDLGMFRYADALEPVLSRLLADT
jgi:hypothetical protein